MSLDDSRITSIRYYNSMSAYRNMIESMIDDVIGRGVEKILMVNFKILVGNKQHGFSVAYYPKNNYVKVFHKTNKNVFESFSENTWVRISDHDSCWRDSWYFMGNLHNNIINDLTKEHSFYITIEKIKLCNVSNYVTSYFSDTESVFNFNIDNEYNKNPTVEIIQVKG